MNRKKTVAILMITFVVVCVAAFVRNSLDTPLGVKVHDVLTVRINGPGEDRAEIGVEVVAVNPNGECVIACHKRITNGNELWTVSLNGNVRTCDIQPNWCINSEVIKDLAYKRSVSYVD